jgi:hypothetical protein
MEKVKIAALFALVLCGFSSLAQTDPVTRVKPYRIEGSAAPGQVIVADAENDGRWNDSLVYWQGFLTINGDTAITEWQIVDEFQIASDILTISLSNDGQAPLSVDLSAYLDNTDTQDLSFAGTTLSLTDGGSVDLSSLQDGTGTDDQTLSLAGNTLSIEDGNSVDLSGISSQDNQTVDTFSLSGTVLTFALERDNESPYTVDLSGLQDGTGTDDQNLTLAGNTLSIESGNSVSLAAYLDNTDTQDLSFAGTTLSLTDGGSVDLSSLQDGTGTDDQQVNTFSLSGTDLTLEIESDGQAPHIVDLSSLQDGTGTDSQTLSFAIASGDLSISSGNTVNIPAMAGATSSADGEQGFVPKPTAGEENLFLRGDGTWGNPTTGGDNWGSQVAQTSGFIGGDGTGPNAISLIQNGASNGQGLIYDSGAGEWTARAQLDSQSLSFAGTTLSLTNGGSVDLSILQDGTGTDDQQIQLFSLSGTTLEIDLEGDASSPHTVNLSSLQDGTGTDDQKVNTFSLSGTDLTLEIEGDGQAPHVVDLSSLQDGTGTDDQNLTLASNTLSIESGNSVSLAAYLDNTDTQDLSLAGTTLSLTNGGSVDLSGYLDNTDRQTVDTFSLSGTILTLTLENDNETPYSVNLSSLQDGTGTDNQALSYGGGGSLSISNGNSVDLSDLLDNTDTQDLSLAGTTLSLTNGGSVDLSGIVGDDDWRFTGTENHSSHAFRIGQTSIGTSSSGYGLRVDTNFQFNVYGNANTFDWQDGTGRSVDKGLMWEGAGGSDGSGPKAGTNNSFILSTDDAAIGANDVLGSILFSGEAPGLGAVRRSAMIKAYASAGWTSLNNATDLSFYAVPSGSTTLSRIMSLKANERIELPSYSGFSDGIPDYFIGMSNAEELTRHSIAGTASDGKVLKLDSGGLSWQDDNEGAAAVSVDLNLLRDTIEVTGHGFTASQTPIPFFVDRSSGSVGNIGAAVNSSDEKTHSGFIVEVLSVDSLVVATGGVFNKSGHGYLIGRDYFTTGTAHSYDTIAPAGQINDFVWTVLDANRLLLKDVRPYDPSDDSGASGGLWFSNGTIAEFVPASDTLGVGGVNGISVDVFSDSLQIGLDLAGLTSPSVDGADFMLVEDQSTGLAYRATVSDIAGAGTAQSLSITEATGELSISSGNTVDLSELIDEQVNTLLVAGSNITLTYDDSANTLTVDADDTQDLSLVGNSLQLVNGGSVDLSGYLDNTDSQTLSFNVGAGELSISGGNTINISDINTDDQTLSFDNAAWTVSISDGNTIDIGELIEDKMSATIVGGTDIEAVYNDVLNEVRLNYTGTGGGDPDQTLSFTSTSLTISGTGGNTVDISHAATHLRAGADEIDGDQIDIDWNPIGSYTPSSAPSEVSHPDHLTAHLYGIGEKLSELMPNNKGSQTSGAIDWNGKYNGFVPISMTGASSKTITMTGALSGGGAYIIRFTGADDTDTVTWPANVEYEDGSAVGTDILADGRRMVQMYYDGTDYIIAGGY